jgi:hypothetical protein
LTTYIIREVTTKILQKGINSPNFVKNSYFKARRAIKNTNKEFQMGMGRKKSVLKMKRKNGQKRKKEKIKRIIATKKK